MKNKMNIKKIGALLLTGALMAGAIVGTNAITAKAADGDYPNMSTFLLEVPSEITVQTNVETLEGLSQLRIYTTGTMPTTTLILLKATSNNSFKLLNKTSEDKTIPYGLVCWDLKTNYNGNLSRDLYPIDRKSLDDNGGQGFTIDGKKYTHAAKIAIAAMANPLDIDKAGEGDYEDDITFEASMQDMEL